MESNSFHVGQILEVLLRDGSDLEDEGSAEECLKFKKVIWTVFIMSFRRKAVSWKDRFDLKRDMTCLCDYQSTKVPSEEIMFQLNSVIF